MANQWTKEQQNAIDARRGTVLVSAAAGSGKTAVLVQRVMERLCDPISPTDADRLLIVTFTKAAAAEMRERIESKLAAMLEQSPGDRQLKRQQMLLRRAQISTIHSFCSRVIKENFYKLNISPDFSIVDSSELELLRQKAVNEVLQQAYEEGSSVFYQLVETFSGERDDKNLIAAVLQVYDFTRSHPFPEQWMQETEALYDPALPVKQTVWGKVMLRQIKEAVEYGISLTETAIQGLQEDPVLAKSYLPALESDRSMLLGIASLCETGTWDAICSALENREFIRLGIAKGYKEDPLAEWVKSLRGQVKDIVDKKLRPKLFTESECLQDIARQRELIKELFRVTRLFAQRLDEIKAEKHTADFGDLERWTLKLLFEKRDGTYIRTADAQRIAQQFDEIIVDEYQDTNQAQDMIFRAISQDESNLFFVGDVKQSIYGFRQAMPQIFLDRRSAYPEYDREKDQYPACITLDRNFRSRKTVTDSVNFFFRQLMSKGCGDLDYDDREALVAGAAYPPQEGMETVLDIIEADAVQDDALEEDMAVLEARRISQRIGEMMASGFQVTDHGVKRPATYSDFAILLRSANNHMAKYVKELLANGIPAKAGKNPGFFQTAEIAVVLSLLRIISNPMQDIPLTAVLMSPLYGFTPDDMAKIRDADRKNGIYLALQQAAGSGMQKAADFLEQLQNYRTISVTLSADQMIHHIYETSGYTSIVQAMTNGERRLANLQMLQEYAKQFESAGYHGTAGFVQFVDQLQKNNGDLSGGESTSGIDNAVRIMSIHNSKGLEFPVCILAGCNRQFNRVREDVLIHPSLGLGVKLRSADSPSRYTTLMRESIAIAKDQESMAEELRIFYVALTRAKEKLILLTTEKKLSNRLALLGAGLNETEQLSPYFVSNAASFSDWILTCALRHPDGQVLRDFANLRIPVLRNDSVTPWEIRRVLPEPAWEAEQEGEKQAVAPDMELLTRLRQRMDYQYPYLALLDLPSKVTASALAEAQRGAGESFLSKSLARPAFLSKKGLTPAERGTATHTFLQFCDFSAVQTQPEAELERLVQAGFLSPEQGSAVDFGKVTAFCESDLARRMFQSPNLWREYRFTTEIPPSLVQETLTDLETEQTVVLQGAVDCVFEEDGQLVIVDYKTDTISDESVLWNRYAKQLELYAMAMTQCIGLSVKETLLYSFYLSRSISQENLKNTY